MSSGLMTNLYELLGIDCTADSELINQRFLQLSKSTINLNEKIQIYQAYRILSTPGKRRNYDKTLLMGLLNPTVLNNKTAQIYSSNNHKAKSVTLPIQTAYDTSYDNDTRLVKITEPIENQREFQRLPFEKHIFLNDDIEVNTLDISPKGLQIQLPNDFNQNGVVNVHSHLLHGRAKICFTSPGEQGEVIAGLCFLKVKFNPQLLVSEFV